ncbi:MAG: hypothetical protein A2277_03445 [Desulfobacterales bacterium RIFOXYA12_FULL_46_15]|nr:MAG: hypothetical protein A2277_03445 [Desulfobacterales bacterium RIFOXYA12_FULL_46_15]
MHNIKNNKGICKSLETAAKKPAKNRIQKPASLINGHTCPASAINRSQLIPYSGPKIKAAYVQSILIKSFFDSFCLP